MRKACRRKPVDMSVSPLDLARRGVAMVDAVMLAEFRKRELAQIEALATGQAVKKDWEDLAGMVNLAEVMARDGVGPEAIPACLEASEALLRIRERYLAGKGLVADGPGLNAIRDVQQYHDLQRQAVTIGKLVEYERRTNRELQQRKRQMVGLA